MISNSERPIVFAANTSWYLFNFRRLTIFQACQMWPGRVVCVAGDADFRQKLEALGATCITTRVTREYRRPTVLLQELSDLMKTLRRQRPVVMCLFTSKIVVFGSWVNILVGADVIANVSGQGEAATDNSLRSRVYKMLLSLSLLLSKVTYFQNYRDMELFDRWAVRWKGCSRLIMGSGVDLDEFRYTPPRKTKSDVTFLMMTRLLRSKGVELFAESAKALGKDHGCNFILCGSIEDDESYVCPTIVKDWVDAGVLRYYSFTGDPATMLEQCDCLVLPTWYGEGTPKILLEAAAVGRPVITTDIPGCREAVSRETGWLIEPQNSVKLIEAMKEYLELTCEERLAMGAAARSRAELFMSEAAIASGYCSDIKALLETLEPENVGL